MGAKVSVLPSKIVQIVNIPNSNYYSAWLLCDDGSLWVKANTAAPIFDRVHPPHEPPAHAADLAEALEVVSNLVDWGCVAMAADIESREAFLAAEELLKKHRGKTCN